MNSKIYNNYCVIAFLWYYLIVYCFPSCFENIWIYIFPVKGCRIEAYMCEPMIGAYVLWAGQILQRGKPAINHGLGLHVHCLFRRTASFSHVVKQTRGIEDLHHGKEYFFVCLYVWDLSSHSRICTHMDTSPLWGAANFDLFWHSWPLSSEGS